MHTLLRQVEFRLVAELLLAILVPIAAFLWWRFGLDRRVLAFMGWRQRVRTRLLGPPKPEMFYTDERGRLRRVEPGVVRHLRRAFIWSLHAIAIGGIVGFVGANIHIRTPAFTILLGAFVLGIGYLIVWASWKAWADQQE